MKSKGKRENCETCANLAAGKIPLNWKIPVKLRFEMGFVDDSGSYSAHVYFTRDELIAPAPGLALKYIKKSYGFYLVHTISGGDRTDIMITSPFDKDLPDRPEFIKQMIAESIDTGWKLENAVGISENFRREIFEEHKENLDPETPWNIPAPLRVIKGSKETC